MIAQFGGRISPSVIQEVEPLPSSAPTVGIEGCGVTDSRQSVSTSLPDLVWFGNPTFAGSYRLAEAADGERYLQANGFSGWTTVPQPLPAHISDPWAAAIYLGV